MYKVYKHTETSWIVANKRANHYPKIKFSFMADATEYCDWKNRQQRKQNEVRSDE